MSMSKKRAHFSIYPRIENLFKLAGADSKKMTYEKRIEIAVRCALEVYQGKVFVRWANDWLSDSEKRMQKAIASIDKVAEAVANTTWDSEDAIDAAMWATEAVGRVSVAPQLAQSSMEGAWGWVTEATSKAIEATSKANPNIDIVSIIKAVMK